MVFASWDTGTSALLGSKFSQKRKETRRWIHNDSSGLAALQVARKKKIVSTLAPRRDSDNVELITKDKVTLVPRAILDIRRRFWSTALKFVDLNPGRSQS